LMHLILMDSISDFMPVHPISKEKQKKRHQPT